MPNRRSDHRIIQNFRVEIDGIAGAHFAKVSGLESRREVFEYHEGGENTRMLRFPGPAIQSEIVLERGYTDNDELFQWLNDAISKNERMERRSGSIILLDDEGNEVKRWNFHRAFPIRWKVPEFTSQKTATMIESLTLAHEGLELTK